MLLFDGDPTTRFRYRAARSRRSWFSLRPDAPLNGSIGKERFPARKAQRKCGYRCVALGTPIGRGWVGKPARGR